MQVRAIKFFVHIGSWVDQDFQINIHTLLFYKLFSPINDLFVMLTSQQSLELKTY